MGSIGYYGFLATRIAPQRLLATAARRVAKVARNRLAPPLGPRPSRLLDVLGCDGAPMLARVLSRPRPSRPPYGPSSLRRALERHLPGEVERALARAASAAAGRIEVFGRTLDVSIPGGGTDWQLDPVHEGRFSAWAPSGALPDAPGLDVKMAWAIGRGDQWVALAQGALLDRERARDFAAALAASVHDFAYANPVGRGVHWSCAMEAALRAFDLVLALWLLSATEVPLAPELAMDAACLLVSTGRFVLAQLEDDTAVPGNHLAADWLGLLACAEGLPEWPEAPRWRALAVAGLSAALRDQMTEDGTSFEGSIPYHRFATEIFAAGTILTHGARHGVGREHVTRLRAAFRAARSLLSSRGEIPQIGDDDSGRVLALRERGPTDGGYLLPLGAALLRDPSLLVEPGPGDAAEVAWLLGPGSLDVLAAMRPPARRPGSASFPAGGFHVLRRGHFEAFMSCGPNGQRGIGGHSHNDKLSIELFAKGSLAVCDSGSPTYTGDPELRDAFRSTRAHATVMIDGLEQAPILPGRPFALPDVAEARLLAFDPGGPADRLLGEHRGFVRAGVVHQREVWTADAGVAVIERLLGRGAHRVEMRWPFATPLARVRPLSADEVAAFERVARAARLRHAIDSGAGVEVPLDGGDRLLVAFALPPGLAPEIGPSLRSPGYGRLANGSTALVAGALRCPATLATLFILLPGEGSAVTCS